MRSLLLAGLAVLALQAQPAPQRFTLPNGLRVVHLEDHEHPLVRIRLHLRVAPADTPAGQAGLSLLALRMLAHSDAADLKAADFDRFLAGSGIRYEAFPEAEGLGWRLLARSRDQDRAMGLLADRLLRSTFDAPVLEVQRLACWRDQEHLARDPQGHPLEALAHLPALRFSQSSLGLISMESLLAFQAQVFRPDRAILILHGDLGLEQAKRLVLLSFGSWPVRKPSVGTTPAPGIATAQPPAGPEPGKDGSPQAGSVPIGPLAPEVLALLGLLLPEGPALVPGKAGAKTGSYPQERLASLRQRGFEARDLERAKAAWLANRRLDSLHPESLLESALANALGRGVAEEGVKALPLEALNAGLRRWLAPQETLPTE